MKQKIEKFHSFSCRDISLIENTYNQKVMVNIAKLIQKIYWIRTTFSDNINSSQKPHFKIRQGGKLGFRAS